MTAAVVALGVAVAVLAVLVVGLLRSHADVLRALHELGVGENELGGQAAGHAGHTGPMPVADPGIRTIPGVPEPGPTSALGRLADVDGVDPHGGAVRVGLVDATRPTLLAFLSTGCSTCADFWRAFDTDEIDDVPGDGTRVVIVTRGPEEESPGAVAALAPSRATTVMSTAAWDAYGVPVSPYFVLVDGAQGVVGEGASASWTQVVDLLGKAAADAGLTVGGAESFTRRDLLRGRDREQRADRALAEAGIQPGSTELYRGLHDLDGAPADDEAHGGPP